MEMMGVHKKLIYVQCLNLKSILRFLFAAHLSITASLKFDISCMSTFSIDSIAKAVKVSWFIELLKKVFMRFSVEKLRNSSNYL